MGTLSPTVDDQSSVDYDDSSRRSWMSSSNLSFGSRRSSISEASSFSTTSTAPHKPHKSNQAGWQAIRRLQAARGQVGLDQFRLLRRVGSGDIGNVYLCQIRNPMAMVGLPQCFYAMKVVDKEALAIRKKDQRAETEKEILGMVDHPFLPTLYADFEASHYSCLVMEFCPGGDLYAARLRQPNTRFTISSAKFYAAEVLLALEYLHMMGIVYRDLKPENVLVREDGHIMLSDFDLCLKCDVVPELLRTKTLTRTNSNLEIRRTRASTRVDCHDDDEEEGTCFTPTCSTPMRPVLSCLRRGTSARSLKIIRERADGGPITPTTIMSTTTEFDTELVAEPTSARSKSFVGTHEYLAPEVISGQGHGSAVDWWTLGVFLYEMLYGRTPFKGENNERTLVNILKQPLTFPRIGVLSSSKEYEDLVRVQDLISRLLVKNPKRRIGSLKGSVEIKRHDFFKGVNWALIRSVKPPEVPNDHYYKFRSSRGGALIPKLTKKERQEPYQIPPHHFDYF